jgi:hypothetical protein
VEEEEYLEDMGVSLSADMRVFPCLKYNLRCLLHTSIQLKSELAAEWKEDKDKKSGQVRCDRIRPHMSACVSIRQHTSAYVSIRQHTSAYGEDRWVNMYSREWLTYADVC